MRGWWVRKSRKRSEAGGQVLQDLAGHYEEAGFHSYSKRTKQHWEI